MSQIITDVDRIKWIRYLQCDLGNLADTTSKAFAFRKKNRECLKEDLILLDNIIRILYDYVTFDDTVTWAYSFTFEKTVSTPSTVELNIDGNAYPYVSSSSDPEDIVDYYLALFNNNVQTPDLYAEKDGTTLYVFSYSTSLNFSDVPTPSSTGSLVTITTASMEDDLQDILDLWNCLSNDEICSLISLGHDIEEECNC